MTGSKEAIMSISTAITTSKFLFKRNLYTQNKVGGACAVAQGRTMPFLGDAPANMS